MLEIWLYIVGYVRNVVVCCWIMCKKVNEVLAYIVVERVLGDIENNV